MATKYTYVGAIGTIIFFIVAAGITLYPVDYRQALADKPEANFLVFEYPNNNKFDFVTLAPDGDYLRWKFDKDYTTFYKGNKIIGQYRLTNPLQYFKTYGIDEWVTLDRKASLINLSYTNTSNCATFIRNTPFYATKSHSGNGGILTENFNICSEDTFEDFPKSYIAIFEPGQANKNKDYRLTFDGSRFGMNNYPSGIQYINGTSLSFDNNVKVEWQKEYDEAKLNVDSKELTIRFPAKKGEQIIHLRVFDPVIISTQTGDWNDNATWGGGAYPFAGEDVIVKHNVSIIGEGNNASTIGIDAGAHLNILTNTTTGLAVTGNTTINAGGVFSAGHRHVWLGGVDNYGLLEIRNMNLSVIAEIGGTAWKSQTNSRLIAQNSTILFDADYNGVSTSIVFGGNSSSNPANLTFDSPDLVLTNTILNVTGGLVVVRGTLGMDTSGTGIVVPLNVTGTTFVGGTGIINLGFGGESLTQNSWSYFGGDVTIAGSGLLNTTKYNTTIVNHLKIQNTGEFRTNGNVTICELCQDATYGVTMETGNNGTFNAKQSSGNITIGSFYIGSGSTFNATSGTTTLSRRQSGGTTINIQNKGHFDHNNGLVNITQNIGTTLIELRGTDAGGIGGLTLNNLSHSTGSSTILYNAVGDIGTETNLFILGNFNLVQATIDVKSGTENDVNVKVNGTLTIASGTTFLGEYANISAGILIVSGTYNATTKFTDITYNNPSGTTTILNLAGATFNHNQGTVRILTSGAGTKNIVTQSSAKPFYNLYFMPLGTTQQLFYAPSGGGSFILEVRNNLSIGQYATVASSNGNRIYDIKDLSISPRGVLNDDSIGSTVSRFNVTGNIQVEGVLDASLSNWIISNIGSMTIASGGIYNATAGTTNITNGNWTNGGSYTHNAGRVIFGSGTGSNQSITGTNETTFFNLNITNGVVAVTQEQNTTVEGVLDIATGATYIFDATDKVLVATFGNASGGNTKIINSGTLSFAGNRNNFVKIIGARGQNPITISGTDWDWDSGGSGSAVNISNVDYQIDSTTGGGGVTVILDGTSVNLDSFVVSAGDSLNATKSGLIITIGNATADQLTIRGTINLDSVIINSYYSLLIATSNAIVNINNISVKSSADYGIQIANINRIIQLNNSIFRSGDPYAGMYVQLSGKTITGTNNTFVGTANSNDVFGQDIYLNDGAKAELTNSTFTTVGFIGPTGYLISKDHNKVTNNWTIWGMLDTTTGNSTGGYNGTNWTASDTINLALATRYTNYFPSNLNATNNFVVGGMNISNGTNLIGSNYNLSLGSLYIISGGLYNATTGTTTLTSENPDGRALDNLGTITHNSGLFNITTTTNATINTGKDPLFNLQIATGIGNITLLNNTDLAGGLNITSGILDTNISFGHRLTASNQIILNSELYGRNSSNITFSSVIINSGGRYNATSGKTVFTDLISNSSLIGAYIIDQNGSSIQNLRLNQTIFNLTAYNITLYDVLNVTLSDPTGARNTSNYVNISQPTYFVSAWAFLNISYTTFTTETNIDMFKHNGTRWNLVPQPRGRNTEGNYVFANISSFSPFAPMENNIAATEALLVTVNPLTNKTILEFPVAQGINETQSAIGQTITLGILNASVNSSYAGDINVTVNATIGLNGISIYIAEHNMTNNCDNAVGRGMNLSTTQQVISSFFNIFSGQKQYWLCAVYNVSELGDIDATIDFNSVET